MLDEVLDEVTTSMAIVDVTASDNVVSRTGLVLVTLLLSPKELSLELVLGEDELVESIEDAIEEDVASGVALILSTLLLPIDETSLDNEVEDKAVDAMEDVINKDITSGRVLVLSRLSPPLEETSLGIGVEDEEVIEASGTELITLLVMLSVEDCGAELVSKAIVELSIVLLSSVEAEIELVAAVDVGINEVKPLSLVELEAELMASADVIVEERVELPRSLLTEIDDESAESVLMSVELGLTGDGDGDVNSISEVVKERLDNVGLEDDNSSLAELSGSIVEVAFAVDEAREAVEEV